MLGSALILIAVPASDTNASDVVLGTGRQGGSYHYIGVRLRHGVRIAQDLAVELRETGGSQQNLEALHDPKSDVNAALTQSDALGRFEALVPDFAGSYFVLGSGTVECVFVIADAKGSVRELSDLAEPAAKALAIGQPGSGAQATWDAMTRLEPKLQAADARAVDALEALLQIRSAGAYSEITAAVVVERPAKTSPVSEAFYRDRDAFRLVPISPAEIRSGSRPSGAPVYAFEEVQFGDNRPGTSAEVTTMCTRSLLIGSKAKLEGSVRGKLSDYMLEHGDRVMGHEE